MFDSDLLITLEWLIFVSVWFDRSESPFTACLCNGARDINDNSFRFNFSCLVSPSFLGGILVNLCSRIVAG
uniref:Uncharacterized protein n=1 Tax=Tetranychus urticae TaxID=32264 RepID=T1L1H9_TETUR